MKMKVMIDEISCDCQFSAWSWIRTFISILIHPEHPEKWYLLEVTNIKGNPKYEDYTSMLIHPQNFDWKEIRKKSFENWSEDFQKYGLRHY